MRPEKYETGSGGFVWENLMPDNLFSHVKFHVYTAHDMQIGREWAGDQFINHYNRIYYIESGEGELVFKDKKITMKPGYLYLIPPYQLISHSTKDGLHFLWTHFQASLEAELDLFMLYGQTAEIDVSDKPEYKASFLKLISAVNDKQPSGVINRKIHLLNLVAPFIQQFQQTEIHEAGFRHQSLLPALNKINANLTNPPDIKELAQDANMSPEHFSRKFKAAFNIAPKRYILAKRIELAKQLLLLEGDSVEQVAERCGFCDLYHFSRTFKQETGSSPTAFRKNFVVAG
ncbi:AraC family transcriptional regulator [Saccharobesus litoralis]|uniref:AraC family transcriptional regulator n=1 Tax=Saccharobesus litoralis TaxID=2172099 RepID=A0A2S0VV46_9ALTE|nr:AraC family transcriptional regulator [Saccharobesus litoralis]AWB68053.1 AraC family transcriptional regulator [Saccharobesus litoralis]